MSTPIRTVECKYNKCGKLFTSKARMKEHVLWHLETDPPIRVHQHAIVRELPSGGWVVVRDLGFEEGSSEAGHTSAAGGTSHVDNSEIDKFRITDIVPSASQAGNITTTTTTSGTTSQPYPFSPALPTQPSQLTLPSQSPIRPYHSQPILRSTSQSREAPFVHSAPRPSPTPSPSMIRKRLSQSPALIASPVKRTRLSPFVPSQDAISSTPILHGTQNSMQSDADQYPPSGKDTPIKVVQRTFGFGEALGLSEKATPVSGVTFGFGTR